MVCDKFFEYDRACRCLVSSQGSSTRRLWPTMGSRCRGARPILLGNTYVFAEWMSQLSRETYRSPDFASDATYQTFQTHPEHHDFLSRFSSVGSDYIMLWNCTFSKPLLPRISASVASFTVYRLKKGVDHVFADDLMDKCTRLVENHRGSHGYTWSLAKEQGGPAILAGGWDSIEVHNRLHSSQS
jgi:hypothetical protein